MLRGAQNEAEGPQRAGDDGVDPLPLKKVFLTLLFGLEDPVRRSHAAKVWHAREK